jgi:mannose-6-phosphate isomerase-like protein (cupin superfamily)
MPIANWKTQSYNLIQSLLFANPHRVIRFLVCDEDGNWRDRTERPAPVRRIYETDAPPERSCLQTIQCVQHMLIPPGGRHVEELHIHPDAEELVVVTRGEGTAVIGDESLPIKAEDVLYIPPNTAHEVRNTSDDLLGVLFLAAPVGEGLTRLVEQQKEQSKQ